MGERLALAVEISNRGAGGIAALRRLPDAGRAAPARPRAWSSTRCAARRRTATCSGMLGRIHLARRDWARAGQVAAHPARPGRPGGGGAWPRASTAGGLARRGPAARRRWRCSRRWPRPAATTAMADAGARAASPPATPPAPQAYLDGCSPATRRSRPARTAAGRAAAMAGDPAEAEALLPRGDRRGPGRPGPYRALFGLLAGTASPTAAARRARRRHRRRRRTTAGCSSPGPACARPRRLAGADRRLRDALRPRQRRAGGRQQPREPADRAAAPTRRRSSAPSPSPGGCAGSRRAAVPGHLRLDPAPARRLPPRRSTYLAAAAAALPGNAQVQFHLGEAGSPSATATAAARLHRGARAARAPAARCRRPRPPAPASPRLEAARRPATAPATAPAAIRDGADPIPPGGRRRPQKHCRSDPSGETGRHRPISPAAADRARTGPGARPPRLHRSAAASKTRFQLKRAALGIATSRCTASSASPKVCWLRFGVPGTSQFGFGTSSGPPHAPRSAGRSAPRSSAVACLIPPLIPHVSQVYDACRCRRSPAARQMPRRR